MFCSPLPEVKNVSFQYGVGNLLAVHLINHNQGFSVIRRGIDPQGIPTDAERFSVVGKLLDLSGNIDADTVRHTIVGGRDPNALPDRAKDPNIEEYEDQEGGPRHFHTLFF
jgi:hypothetical protein